MALNNIGTSYKANEKRFEVRFEFNENQSYSFQDLSWEDIKLLKSQVDWIIGEAEKLENIVQDNHENLL